MNSKEFPNLLLYFRMGLAKHGVTERIPRFQSEGLQLLESDRRGVAREIVGVPEKALVEERLQGGIATIGENLEGEGPPPRMGVFDGSRSPFDALAALPELDLSSDILPRQHAVPEGTGRREPFLHRGRFPFSSRRRDRPRPDLRPGHREKEGDESRGGESE